MIEENIGKMSYIEKGNYPRNNWLICDGREVSIKRYSKLYGVIKDGYETQHDTYSDPGRFYIPDIPDTIISQVTKVAFIKAEEFEDYKDHLFIEELKAL